MRLTFAGRTTIVCLIACAWRADPRFELLLVANRDEFHARPTAPAERQRDAADVIGGRDLAAGGSWLQWSSRGRLAAVTNLRVGMPPAERPRSRGSLVAAFVRSSEPAEAFLARVAGEADDYGRFNLLLWDRSTMRLASNHPRFSQLGLLPGQHALSNGPFGSRWPKSARIADGLAGWLGAHHRGSRGIEFDGLFELLADRSPAADGALPDTGVGLERERLLAPVFIAHPDYGTRCSTVLAIDRDGRWWFEERRFGADGEAAGSSRFDGQLNA
jgi:uncharacterized protein with NRDE domain